jgi:hypothetical protein
MGSQRPVPGAISLERLPVVISRMRAAPQSRKAIRTISLLFPIREAPFRYGTVPYGCKAVLASWQTCKGRQIFIAPASCSWHVKCISD